MYKNPKKVWKWIQNELTCQNNNFSFNFLHAWTRKSKIIWRKTFNYGSKSAKNDFFCQIIESVENHTLSRVTHNSRFQPMCKKQAHLKKRKKSCAMCKCIQNTKFWPMCKSVCVIFGRNLAMCMFFHVIFGNVHGVLIPFFKKTVESAIFRSRVQNCWFTSF